VNELKEYIITEEQLQAIEKWDSRHLGKEYRSRSYPEIPQGVVDTFLNKMMESERIEVIRKSRGDLLKEIKVWRVDQEVKKNCGLTNYKTTWIDESKYLESLRTLEKNHE
jgi:hypothetical protein